MDEILYTKAREIKSAIYRIEQDIMVIECDIKEVEKASDKFPLDVRIPFKYKDDVIGIFNKEKELLEEVKTRLEKEFEEL